VYNTKDVIGFTRTYRCLTVIYTSNRFDEKLGTMQNNLGKALYNSVVFTIFGSGSQ